MLRKSIFFLLNLLPVFSFGQGFFYSEFSSSEENEHHLQVWDVSQDTNQYIHFGDYLGFSAFNGRRWHFSHIGESGRGTSLLLSREGMVYASGQYDFGYLISDSINNSVYHSISEDYYTATDIVNNHFNSFEYKNSIYFNGWQGLEIFDGDSLYKYTIENVLYPNAFLFGDRIFVSNEFGLNEFRNGTYQLIPSSTTNEGSRNVFTVELSEKKVFLGYVENGLYTFDGYSVSKFDTEIDDYLIEHQMYDATLVNDSTLAIATLQGGLVLLDTSGKVKYIYNSNTGFDKQGVLSTYIDHEETLWLGLWGGIEKIQTNIPIKKYSVNEGLESEVLEFYQLDNRIFVKTINQLLTNSLIEPENATLFSEIFSSEVFNIYSDLIANSKGVFISNDNGVFKMKNSIVFEKIYDGEIFELVENYDDPDQLMFINNEGLVTVKDGTYYKESFSIPSNIVEEAVFKDAELFFISDKESIYRFSNDSISKIEIDNNLNFRTIFNKIGVLNGEIYVGTEGAEGNGGLYLFNEQNSKLERASEFGSTHEAIYSKQVVTFDQCKSGDIWIQNDKQIKRIKKIQNEWVVQSSPYQLIGEGNGIYSIKCEDDGIWFGGVNGLYHLTDPDWDYKTDFKTNITDIFVNRDSLIYGGFGEPVKPIVLPYKDNELRFNYAAASYIDPERNTYSYKLEGFDTDWSEWSLETQKDYTNIPEGEYIFKVRSKNVFEVDGKPDQIAFTVLPPWYRTWWAYMLYFISFSCLLYTGYKIRVNQLLKVERMRNKIASDLHDEVSATLTGISYFAEAIKRDKDPSRSERFVSLISESAGDAKEKITDIVWSINPENDSWELFLSKCRRFASDLLESKELEYTLNITEHVPGKLSMEVRQHLWMIFKEMVTNAVRHSVATRLDVIMDIENGILKLIVQDNGKGFDLDEIQEGNGIRNIQKRAAKIGAVIKIHSEEDFGTRWRMELPL